MSIINALLFTDIYGAFFIANWSGTVVLQMVE